MNADEGLKAERFVARWSDLEGGQERANCSLFLTELCDVLGVNHPDPASASHQLNDYVFERRVERALPDGTREVGRIDLYKRDHFILEAKQSRLKQPELGADLFSSLSLNPAPGSSASGFDHLMIKARRQAEAYALALPANHEYPPFILVCDIGRSIELYADFSGHGRHYRQFPDANGFRLTLASLKTPATRNLLYDVWTRPKELDPAVKTAKVTREIAGKLAAVSKALEDRDFEPRSVAIFLMRCLFTMFVEDVGLIRKNSFKDLLDRCLVTPRRFPLDMADLWRHMDVGDYSPVIGEKLLRFNGKLFKKATALPLVKNEIELLREAAAANWCDLEPAIFGSLFEQAIDLEERKRLGTHYTPRAYVERLVDATIIEPLTIEWIKAQSAAERACRNGSRSQAVREVVDFLKMLSSMRVLDPACGTGNFLYVALRRMKQLEGEVLQQLQDIGGEKAVSAVGDISVKPDQFFGLELNRRAVEIAELVLWIGYLQWHLRTRSAPPAEPILGNSDHVRDVNAVLSWTKAPALQLKRSGLGKPITKRDGSPVYAYPNPSIPEWPVADFIVGNPPFIGGKDVRNRLGDEYVKALWQAHPDINPSADYVMYWWDHAARLLKEEGSRLRRFGFVTTNSITQVFQRRIVEQHLKADDRPISLVFAISDHPWTKSTKDAAAVRIAMTVAQAGTHDGVVHEVVRERELSTDEPKIEFVSRAGRINADLTVGADVTRAKGLLANEALCSPGVKLHGDAFAIDHATARSLGLGRVRGLERYIRDYRNGRDLTSRSRNLLVIDMLGLSADDVRKRFPGVYQYLIERVKPERDKNNRSAYRTHWWLFGEPRRELRPALAGLSRYIATVETTKHRVFQFLDAAILPDNMIIAIGTDDAFHLGVLSSRIHVTWSLRAGGWLGVGNDPRYSKSRCFDPFPFPDASRSLRKKIAEIANELDLLRKKVREQNPDIALTALYNVLEEIKIGERLNSKSEDIKGRGQVLILKDLHEQIDALVAQAYGWPMSLSDDDILQRLVLLNAERAAEESRGLIRWIRPEYQISRIGPLVHGVDRIQAISVAKRSRQRTFPVEEKAQAGEILNLLKRSRQPLSSQQIAGLFNDGNRVIDEIRDVLKSLDRLGQAETFDGGRSYFHAAV